MKLLYTDIRSHLTDQLARLADDYAKSGHRVFYIAPNSLSFEKERRVLESLEQGASFNITVTRFAQMARYFVLNHVSDKKPLTDTGLSMLFFRVLSQLEEGTLKIYGSLRKDSNFISQLVDLYKELQRSGLTILDLQGLESDLKYQDLVTIFTALYEGLQAEDFEAQTKISQFLQQIEAGAIDQELNNLVVIVDGFSRFSAEEENLISTLHAKGVEIVVATYASPKAYQASFLADNLYQANVEFLLDLGQKFGIKAQYIGAAQADSLGRLTALLEGRHDFTGDPSEQLAPADQQALELWSVISQKEEVEQVAREIRRLLQQGERYKDIAVLLGDPDAYRLHLASIFPKYDIPYNLARPEAMDHHPLVNFIESLERLKRYNFRAEDLLNLVKSGLFKELDQQDLDKFEQYVKYADLKGRAQFERDFTANLQQGLQEDGSPRYKFDLTSLNQIRQNIMAPLLDFFSSRRAVKGSYLLNQRFLPFLQAIDLPANMARLSQGQNQAQVEKEEEVWKSFSDLLAELNTIFGEASLKIDDFLALLKMGIKASHYRTIPATVDVVAVSSYDLIEPHTKPYVFALGMTAKNFPKIQGNQTLLTDEERSDVNERLLQQEMRGHLDIATQENVKKNHSVFVSLLNAATKRLVLSSPQLLNEQEDKVSPYLQELMDLGLEPIEKGGASFSLSAQDLGTYKALLSRLIEANQLVDDRELTKDQQTFWSVMVRRLRQKLAQQAIAIPSISNDLSVEPISQEALDLLYPSQEPLRLSASSLSTFYNNQYAYFLRYILKLEEEASIHPDFRHHGIYLHKIFETVLANATGSEDFDQVLDQAIRDVSQEEAYQLLYQSDQEGQLTREILLDIARSTATILRDNESVQVLDKSKAKHYLGDKDWQDTPSQLKALELGFHYDLPLSDERKLEIRGQIDRVDQLRFGESLGIVDYKSGDRKFNLGDFYNGLSPQLLTYILALKEQMPADYQTDIFGAMYLHMKDPEVEWSKLDSLDEAAQKFVRDFKYQGLFSSPAADKLNKLDYSLSKNRNLFSQEDLDSLLAYTKKLYSQAARTILSGRFAINPYTKDGRSVEGDQLKNITGFEANLHMKYARPLLKVSQQDYLDLIKDEEED